VGLSGPSSYTVTASYGTLDGTAQAGSDYVTKSGTVTFSPSVTNTVVSVLVNGDVTIEPDESFYVQLSGAVNAVIGNGLGTGTIINDDGLPGKVDHFPWNPIASPRAVGLPFGVTITARDAFETLVSNFVGTVSLNAAMGGGGGTNTILGNVVP